MGRDFCNRRQFLKQSAATGLAVAQARVRADVASTKNKAAGRYIDVHTHIGRTWNPDRPLTADALVNWMDEHDVAKAVVLPLVSPESSSYLNLTEQGA